MWGFYYKVDGENLMGGIFNCLQQDIYIRDFPSIFSTKPLQVAFVLLMVKVQVSCQKTKYHSIADTMRVSQVARNL